MGSMPANRIGGAAGNVEREGATPEARCAPFDPNDYGYSQVGGRGDRAALFLPDRPVFAPSRCRCFQSAIIRR